MTTSLTATTTTTITRLPAPEMQNAARIYIAGLDSERSKETMEQALSVIAHIATYGTVPPEPDAGTSKAQRQAAAADLRSLIDTIPWVEITASSARAIAAVLKAHYGTRGYNKSVAALRGTLKAAISQVRDAGRTARLAASSTYETMRLAIISQDRQDALQDAIAAVKTIKTTAGATSKAASQAAGRALDLGELMALIAACQDGTRRGARDAALLAIAYSCGLRRAEIASLDLADYDPETGALTVKHGKGDKQRTVYVTNGSLAALADWLSVRGSAAGPLFMAVSRGDNVIARRLTDQGVYAILAAMAEAAAVKRFTPHDMRRTYVSTLLDNGVDLATVSKLAGHANTQTTAAYDRRGERAKKEAAGRLHYPYQHKASK